MPTENDHAPPRPVPALIASMAALGAASLAATIVHRSVGDDEDTWFALVPALAVAAAGAAALLLARRGRLLPAGLAAALPLLAHALLISPSALTSDETDPGLHPTDHYGASDWSAELAAVLAASLAAGFILRWGLPRARRAVWLGAGSVPFLLFGLAAVLPPRWQSVAGALVGTAPRGSLSAMVVTFAVLGAVVAGGAAAAAVLWRERTAAPPVVALMAVQFGLAVVVWALDAGSTSLYDMAMQCRPLESEGALVLGSTSSDGIWDPPPVDVAGTLRGPDKDLLLMLAAGAAVIAIVLARAWASSAPVPLRRTARILLPLPLLAPVATLAWKATAGMRADDGFPGRFPLVDQSTIVVNLGCSTGERLTVADRTAMDASSVMEYASYSIMALLICLSTLTALTLASGRRTPRPSASAG